jgi:hypothetical protein
MPSTARPHNFALERLPASNALFVALSGTHGSLALEWASSEHLDET